MPGAPGRAAHTPGFPPAGHTDTGTTAALTATTWLAAIRALLLRQRPAVAAGADPGPIGAELGRLADHVLDGLAESADHLLRRLRAAAAGAGPQPARPAC